MLKVTIETQNVPEKQSFMDLIKSMISKRFSTKKEVKEVTVLVMKNEGSRTPFQALLKLETEDKLMLETDANSINYLTAFSQALAKMEKQYDKKRA